MCLENHLIGAPHGRGTDHVGKDLDRRLGPNVTGPVPPPDRLAVHPDDEEIVEEPLGIGARHREDGAKPDPEDRLAARGNGYGFALPVSAAPLFVGEDKMGCVRQPESHELRGALGPRPGTPCLPRPDGAVSSTSWLRLSGSITEQLAFDRRRRAKPQ